MSPQMHAHEMYTDADLVRRLLGAQMPQWADLPIWPVESAGTDNAIYRLGDSMAVRMPRIDWAVPAVAKEQRWLPYLAPQLPLPIAEPLAQGQPGAGYPWPWAIYRWLPGTSASAGVISDLEQAALDLARFIRALWRIDTQGAPHASAHALRGAALITRDAATRAAISALDGMIDTSAATAVWETALAAAEWQRAPVWFHGDVLPGNLLVDHGRLSAVIDFSGMGVGDPACDLMIAWALFSDASRAVFRTALAVDAATWMRARGHALSQALIFIPYYLHTNPVGVARARQQLAAVLADYRDNG